MAILHDTKIYIFYILPIPEIVSQNDNDKSCLECIKKKKYAFLVTLRPLGSMRQGEAKLCTLSYYARGSQDTYIITHFGVLLLHQCWSQVVVCVRTLKLRPF